MSIIDKDNSNESKNNVEQNIEKIKSKEKTVKNKKKFDGSSLSDTSVKKPINLIGMKYRELVKLFGKPDIKRLEDPELVIIYKNEICVAHFFLMDSIDINNKKINFLNTYSKKNINTKACIESFLESN